MAESLPADCAAPAGSELPVAQVARFCGKCGMALPIEQSECPACASQASRLEPVRTYAAEMREVKSALWLYFSMLAVSVVMISVALSSRQPPGIELEIFGSVAMTLVVVIWSIVRSDTVAGLLSLRPRPKWYLAALVVPVATFLIATLCMALAGRLVHLQTIDYLRPFRDAQLGFAWAVLVICVQPAVFEELAFRGVMQGSLENIVGPWQAVLASAALFAILHLSILSMPHLALLGLVLAWLRLRSRSIYPGMIVHFLHNLLVLLDEKSGGFLPWS